MLRLQNGEVIYNNSETLGMVETLINTGEGFSITLPDGSIQFIPEEDCTQVEREVFEAYHEFYKDTGGVKVIPPTLDELKQSKIAEIKAKCNAEILGGFNSTARDGVTSEHYNLEYEDQINMEALKNNIVQGLIADGTLTYYASGKTCEPWANAAFLTLYSEAMNFKTVRIVRSKELIVQVQNATTAAGIDSIVW